MHGLEAIIKTEKYFAEATSYRETDKQKNPSTARAPERCYRATPNSLETDFADLNMGSFGSLGQLKRKARTYSRAFQTNLNSFIALGIGQHEVAFLDAGRQRFRERFA
jgi:hypothetical protein